MITITNLTKDYGNDKGNFNINLVVNDNEVYGIIGPNGSGKTTLIRQIMGFISSDSGEIQVNGLNPRHDTKKIMNETGYLPGEITLYNNLTGRQYLQIAASLRGNVEKEWLEKLIKHFDIDVKIKIKKMSKGMKQKLAIIAAVMSKPKFLVLDEPTSGLDPVMQEEFDRLILKIKKVYKATIIICSHIFTEVAKLCDRVGFIKDGKLIYEFDAQKISAEEIETKFKSVYKRAEVL